MNANASQLNRIAEERMFLRREEVAKILGCSVRTLTRWGAEGPPMIRVSDRVIGCKPSDFKAWLDARKARAGIP